LNRIWQLLPGFIVWKIGKRETNISFTPKPLPLLTSGQIFSKMYRKLYVLNIGPRKTSLAIPKKISSSQIGSSTYLVPHPTIPFVPLPFPIPSSWHCPPPGFVK
jgi:hypothetical protein